MKYVTTSWVLLVGLLLAGVGFWVWKMPHAMGGMPPESAPIQPQLAAVDRSTRAIQALTATLSEWNAHPAADRPVELIAEAPKLRHQREQEQAQVAASLKPAQPAHQVNMIYLSSTMRRAIVDDRYVAPGDALPDGAKVLTIQKGEVVLRQKGRRVVVKLQQVPIGSVH